MYLWRAVILTTHGGDVLKSLCYRNIHATGGDASVNGFFNTKGKVGFFKESPVKISKKHILVQFQTSRAISVSHSPKAGRPGCLLSNFMSVNQRMYV